MAERSDVRGKMTEVAGVADKFVELEISKSREEQMRIYATLRCYKTRSEREREYIRALCAEVGGLLYGKALFRFLTEGITMQGAVVKFCVPEGKLRTMRKEVYKQWRL